MPIPNKRRVQDMLPLGRRASVAAVVTRAWARWMMVPDRSQIYRRVRANLVHNYMMVDAIPGLPQEDGIRVHEKPDHETAFFLVDDKLVIRFKKGDNKGLTSNIGTQAALDFNDPNESMTLLGMQDLWRVDIAYVLNDLETQIKDVLVVARNGKRIAWSFSILEGAAEAGKPVQLPITSAPVPSADSGMRVPGDNDGEEQRKDGSS